MTKQLDTFGIFLFFLIIYLLLVAFTKSQKAERKIKLKKDILDNKQGNDEQEAPANTQAEDLLAQPTLSVTLNQSSQEPEPKEISSGLHQQVSALDQPSANLEQLRNVGERTFRIRSFQIQKMGLNEAECEDKSALSSPSSSNLRVAVADGATESLFSDAWADILVNSYVDSGAEFLNPCDLESAHQEFVQKVSPQILQMPEIRHWFMYEKLERGTHATLAAVEISSLEKIQIVTVGDSCVFWHSGNAEKVKMLPELSPEDFGVFPASICHIAKTWQSLEQKIVKQEVLFQDPLQMVLCTDAIACWLVTELQNDGSSAWETLLQLSDYISFTSFVKALREQNNIRNDDVTLVLIDVLPLNV